MFEKVKAWCEYEIENVEKRGYNARNAVMRCYGITMFVANELLGYDSPEGQELAKWWDDEMIPRFQKLYDRG